MWGKHCTQHPPAPLKITNNAPMQSGNQHPQIDATHHERNTQGDAKMNWERPWRHIPLIGNCLPHRYEVTCVCGRVRVIHGAHTVKRTHVPMVLIIVYPSNPSSEPCATTILSGCLANVPFCFLSLCATIAAHREQRTQGPSAMQQSTFSMPPRGGVRSRARLYG